jgi:hypothetical protein
MAGGVTTAVTTIVARAAIKPQTNRCDACCSPHESELPNRHPCADAFLPAVANGERAVCAKLSKTDTTDELPQNGHLMRCLR